MIFHVLYYIRIEMYTCTGFSTDSLLSLLEKTDKTLLCGIRLSGNNTLLSVQIRDSGNMQTTLNQ